MSEPSEKPVDGRRRRSERSRSAIMQAAVDLIREGMLVPTAQQISDRAGVGIRTFFRHFEDMESLFEAVDANARDVYQGFFALGEPRGALTERIEHVVGRNVDGYERFKNFALSTQAQLWRSKVLSRNYARNQRKLREHLRSWLPEIDALVAEQQEAVFAVTSIEMWHRLRARQNLSKAVSLAIVTGLVKDLLKAD